MKRVFDDQLVIVPPQGWTDRTVVTFVSPAGQGPALSVSISQDELRDGENIRSYTDRQLVEFGSKLPKMELLWRKEIMLQGQPVSDLRFVWQGPGGNIEQRMVFVSSRARRVFALAGSAPPGSSAAMDKAVDDMLPRIQVS